MGWRRFLHRNEFDQERARELDEYLEHETADNMARGMSAADARSKAQKKLGNTTLIREEIYQMNSLGLIETLWQDVRYGVRGLWKSPGFTLVALASLALGIGATTAIFSVVYGVLISPYPYAKPKQIWALVIRDRKNPQNSRWFHHMREYEELKKLPAFADTMATKPQTQLLTGDRAPESFQAISVTANAFQFLGVVRVLGRTIQPSDLKSNGEAQPVIVLTFKGWQRLFDGKPSALGKTLVLNDKPYTVIGVMPPRFGWWTSEGGWVVLPENAGDEEMAASIVRLKNGVSPQVAQQQLEALYGQLAKDHPDDYPKAGFVSKLNNYMDVTVAAGEMQSSLRMLFGAVGFLLLIACANVSNLQLSRGTGRAHEIAVRMSIGAGRGRVLRQLLTESVTLSTAGGALGVLLAVALTKVIVALMPEFYVPNEARIEVNTYVLLFSAGVAVLTGIIFGLMPAMKCSRPDLVDALKDAGRALSASSAGGRTRNALVIAEIALSVVLLMGASLTVRGFLQLQSTDVGFQPDRVLMVGLQLPPKRYSTYDQRIAFSERVLAAVKDLPGVQAASIGNGGMPFGGPESTYSIDGQPKNDPEKILLELISSGYLRTLGIPLRAGREFSAQEVSDAAPLALINEAARKLWPAGTNPIGHQIRLDVLEKSNDSLLIPTPSKPVATVVGVIGDTRNAGLRDKPAPAVYVPYTVVAPAYRELALRTRTQPMLLLNAVRERVRTVDKDQPLSQPLTLEDVLGYESVQPRFNMALFTFFGLLGLAMAAIGIYSMLSYSVTRRVHEIGIRMALGADRGNVLSLMLGTGLKLVLIGLGAGLAGSVILARVLRSQVFQVPETDPVALLAVVVLLGGVALLACFLPARRAAKLDPVSALRHE